MAEERTPREIETRSDDMRAQSWTPPSMLPDPSPREGWHHRWIRKDILGEADKSSMGKRAREGYVPVDLSEYPELMLGDSGQAEVGGLILCKIPEEVYLARSQYFNEKNGLQLASVEANLMRESDPRMPLSKPESHTRQSFGRGPVDT